MTSCTAANRLNRRISRPNLSSVCAASTPSAIHAPVTACTAAARLPSAMAGPHCSGSSSCTPGLSMRRRR
ncbi:Uncharacterised protein [Mycobacteroides abscessus subsp. abscessus]|nr:Uncharacterised protein [Mycobacteroides abscessus subsp. abscessus]